MRGSTRLACVLAISGGFICGAGVKANRFVEKYGLRLMPELYECYNPMPYEAAKDMEVELAIGLREAGYGVWQA